ncbi:MAG: hypothetical protein JWM31_131, partial [Solirubrobacterales bacterium]|nr:hypothetical protein [Solirubrobacterales bacterium]
MRVPRAEVPPAMADRLTGLARSAAGRAHPPPVLSGLADPVPLRTWLAGIGTHARARLAACEEFDTQAEEWLSTVLEVRDLLVLCD